MSRDCKLTTFDNPYDPFTNYDEWMMYDKEKGYDSSERLMRIAKISEDMSEVEIDLEIERAIDEIIKYDPINIYKKAVKEMVAH